MEEIIRNKCVYQLRLANRDMPFYVGQGHIDRPKEHFYPCELAMKLHKNNVINKAIRNGIEVLIEYIFIDLTINEAKGTEKTIIALYGRENLTNATDGGEGTCGYKPTQEHIDKISEANIYQLSEALQKFKDAHGNRYDYSLVTEYSGCGVLVDIICRRHGKFRQYPGNHWGGRGCHSCAQIARDRARVGFKHSEESKTRMSESKLGKDYNLIASCIKCRKETPFNHVGFTCDCEDAGMYDRPDIVRASCLICKSDTTVSSLVRDHKHDGEQHSASKSMLSKRSMDDIIEKFKVAHSDIYDYSMITEYIGMSEEYPIICKTHGSFIQSASNHIKGRGCQKCGSESSIAKRTGFKPPRICCLTCNKETTFHAFSTWHKHEQPNVSL